MATGRVKWFDAEKRYGFIVNDDGGPDVFVHATQVNDGIALREDDQVSFNVESGPKGLKATAVVKQ